MTIAHCALLHESDIHYLTEIDEEQKRADHSTTVSALLLCKHCALPSSVSLGYRKTGRTQAGKDEKQLEMISIQLMSTSVCKFTPTWKVRAELPGLKHSIMKD